MTPEDIIRIANETACHDGWPIDEGMERAYSNFMDAVTIRSDFGNQENKICHFLHIFPFYFL